MRNPRMGLGRRDGARSVRNPTFGSTSGMVVTVANATACTGSAASTSDSDIATTTATAFATAFSD